MCPTIKLIAYKTLLKVEVLFCIRYKANEDEALKSIKTTVEDTGVLLDPHTVGTANYFLLIQYPMYVRR